jgi:hypothetical protein
MEDLFLVFGEASTLFPMVVVLIYIPKTVQGSSFFSTSSPTFVFVCVLDGSYSLWLWFAFTSWLLMLSIFQTSVAYVFLREMLYGSIAHSSDIIYSLHLSFWRSIYILDIIFLSDGYFANILFPSVSCLFSVLTLSWSTEHFILFCCCYSFIHKCIHCFGHFSTTPQYRAF